MVQNKSFIAFLFFVASTVHSSNCLVWAQEVAPSFITGNNQEVLLPGSGFEMFEVAGNVAGFFEVILAFDTSGSMAFDAGDTAPNGGSRRFDFAVAGTEALVEGLDDRIRLGLVEFDGVPSLTTEISALGQVSETETHRTELIADVNSLLPDGTNGTDIAAAIEFSGNQFDFNASSLSRHIVLVSDGEQLSGDAASAVETVFGLGLDSFNAVGLPGADNAFLEELTNVGAGTFVDGSDLTDLVDEFSTILSSIEQLERLDIFLPDGSVLENVQTTLNGDFQISGNIFSGQNTFVARATSNLGNETFAELNVVGVSAVPEPASSMAVFAFCVCISLKRRKACLAR